MNEDEIIKSANVLNNKWNLKNWLKKSGFFILQILSAALSSVSGFLTQVHVATYPVKIVLSPTIKQFFIGMILPSSINITNIVATTITTIRKNRRAKWIRIITMILSIGIGIFGFFGISKFAALNGSFFEEGTKYSVYSREQN